MNNEETWLALSSKSADMGHLSAPALTATLQALPIFERASAGPIQQGAGSEAVGIDEGFTSLLGDRFIAPLGAPVKVRFTRSSWYH